MHQNCSCLKPGTPGLAKAGIYWQEPQWWWENWQSIFPSESQGLLPEPARWGIPVCRSAAGCERRDKPPHPRSPQLSAAWSGTQTPARTRQAKTAGFLWISDNWEHKCMGKQHCYLLCTWALKPLRSPSVLIWVVFSVACQPLPRLTNHFKINQNLRSNKNKGLFILADRSSVKLENSLSPFLAAFLGSCATPPYPGHSSSPCQQPTWEEPVNLPPHCEAQSFWHCKDWLRCFSTLVSSTAFAVHEIWGHLPK